MLRHNVPQVAADAPEDIAALHGAWVEIDLAVAAANVRALRARLTPGCRLLAVLKCDAYGHGAEALAPVVLAAGAEVIGVGNVLEGARLRAAGVTAPIFVMAAVPAAAVDTALTHDLALMALSPGQVGHLAARAAALGRAAQVHAMVDVGLGRDGCAPADLQDLVAAIEAAPLIGLVGLGANLATFDERPDGPLTSRLAAFEAATGAIAAARPGLIRHAANSTAAMCREASHYDMVRLGDALYGLADAPELARTLGLRSVMAVRARLVQVRRVPAGTTVGYDSAWTASRPTWLGTLPLGFGDGLPYKLAAGGAALVGGRRCPWGAWA